MAKKLDRKLPVRLSLAAAIVVLFIFTAVAEAVWGLQLQELFKWVVGALGVSIAGDSYRPSGWSPAPKES